MRGMNSASVDLIYLDPPFNSKANYAAPIGSEAAGAEFKDTWSLRDVDIAWLDLIEAKHPALNKVIHAAMTKSDKSYLIYMAVRFIEMHRLLKPTGSIYCHCDPTMSHYLKLVMDAIWGRNQFRNEIIWCYSGPARAAQNFTRKHDVILFYSNTIAVFNVDDVRMRHKRQTVSAGVGMAAGNKTLEEAQAAEKEALKIGKLCPDWWSDIGSGSHMPKNERVGYPTQKPLALLRRIVLASSNKHNVVLDPFCGCATACIAAQDLKRQWVGIDISPKAAELVRYRMDKELPLMFQNVIARNDIPQRTDLGDVPFYKNKNNKKYLYGEQAGICNGCKVHFQLNNLTVDHIIPKSKGALITLITCNYFVDIATQSKVIVAWNTSRPNLPLKAVHNHPLPSL